ncbi:MAG: phospho-sugar mutase [Spirochaetaceae bacterium]|nr:MAG: phospho-sugar mutase [Spirochaetaceae bacterium]
MTEEEIRAKARRYVELEQDELFREQVRTLLDAGDQDELLDRFYTDLEFGTGGLRGVIGGGFNRMNPFVVQRASQGLAQYAARHGEKAPDGSLRAVIAHDSRRYSETFALESALVLAANGIQTYLFSGPRPTPQLSFTVRQLNATIGIVITASHNPPEYNGYKVYWSGGAQIIAPHDKGIIDEVGTVGDRVRRISRQEALEHKLLVYLDETADDDYVAMIERKPVRRELLKTHGSDVRVVYTPLHGTGARFVERVLRDVGVEVITVPEQREPDGDFPTVEFPNPEEASALRMALDLGRRERADLVMATDPDADRLGIAVPDGEDFRLITGNQLGVLLVDYLFSSLKQTGRLPRRPAFVKTIVTTELQRLVAEHYGAEVFDTLTGFKHIAELIRRFETEPDQPTFVMGDEESYGYLIGAEVRDKDAISAALLTTEMALYHVQQGKSVVQRLQEIYQQFGYYEEVTISRSFPGQAGAATMQALMQQLRDAPPRMVGEIEVLRIRDVQQSTVFDLQSGTKRAMTDLPRSNVLQFFLTDGTIVSARPSGTEPKIKFYASASAPVQETLEDARQAVKQKLARIEQSINNMIESVGNG